MMALGQRTSRTAVTGHSIISLRVDNGWREWCLGNQIPEGQPDFGVFEYVPGDQFCYWRDVQVLSPNEGLNRDGGCIEGDEFHEPREAGCVKTLQQAEALRERLLDLAEQVKP